MNKFLFFALVLNLNGLFAQNNSKYTISQDPKGKYELTNNSTKAKIFSKCTSIEYLSGDFKNSDESYRNFILIQNKNNIILFNAKKDSIVYEGEGNEIKVREVYDSRDANEPRIQKSVIEVEMKKRDKPYHVLINVKTSKVIDAGYFYSAAFNPDRTLIRITSDWVIEYSDLQIRDLNGKIIIPITSEKYCKEFSKGFILRTNKTDFNEKYGVVNKQGKITVPFIYKDLTIASDEYIYAEDTLNKVGVITSGNKTLVPFEYRNYYAYDHKGYQYPVYGNSTNGTFVMYKTYDDGNFVLVDTNNTILINTGTYKNTGLIDYYTGRYYVVYSKNDLGGIYDSKLKKEIFPCEYTFYKTSRAEGDEYLLSKGYKKAGKNGLIGLINLETGKVQIPFSYDSKEETFIENDTSPYWYLKKDGKRGMLDLMEGSVGKEYIPFIYDEIHKVEKNYFIVKNNGLYGLIEGGTLKVILPVEFSNISGFRLQKTEGTEVKKGTFTYEGKITWDK